MKVVTGILLVLIFLHPLSAQALRLRVPMGMPKNRCELLRKKEATRHFFERKRRSRFARELVRRVERFLRELTAEERARIGSFGDRIDERSAVLEALQRKLDLAAKGFNEARCRIGEPRFEGDDPARAPVKISCMHGGYALTMLPYYFRTLSLRADGGEVFLQGELFNESMKKTIRATDEFESGSFQLRIKLGDPEDERRQLSESLSAFCIDDVTEYLEKYSKLPQECK